MTNRYDFANWRAGAPRCILLATDLSPRCDRAQDRAMQLADQWEARLVLLHVLDESRRDDPDAAARVREALIRAMAGRDGGFEIELRFGSVGDAVVDAAADVDADLILTGVARHDDIGDYVLGNTVDRLVRASSRPVLVVKDRARQEYAKLLVATDYSACSALALEPLPAFARAAVTLMHAYHVPFEGFIARDANEDEVREQDREACEAFVADLPPATRERLDIVHDYGPVEQVLVRAVRDRAIELALVGTHGTGGLGRALVGSTAESLLGVLPCDVLMVPSPR